MTFWFKVFVSVVFLWVSSTAALAQVLAAPPRPSRGPAPADPNRNFHALATRIDLLGGYDENVSPVSVDAESALRSPGGYSGTAEADLIYGFGRPARGVMLSGHSSMNSYGSVGVSPAYGGYFRARAHTSLARRSELILSHRSGVEPYYQLGAFGAAAEGALAAGTGEMSPTSALRKSRSVTHNADVSLGHNWTATSRTTAGYSFTDRDYASSAAFDGRTQSVYLDHDVPLGSRRLSLRGGYRYAAGRFDAPASTERLVNDQTLDLGLRYSRNLSRTRRISFGAGAGALKVEDRERGGISPRHFQYWSPSGYGTAAVEFRRTWAITADYRRALSILQGLVPDPFLADTAKLRLGGHLVRSVESVFDLGYATARAGQSVDGGGSGRYVTYSGTAQLRLELTRRWSAVVSYNRYHYRLDNVARSSLGLPPRVQRNAARIGLSWSQPLLLRQRRQPQRPPVGRS